MTAVLIYHDVTPAAEHERSGFPGRLAGRYKHTPEQFERHLDAIDATGAGVGLVSSAGPRPDVALTFDDGGASAVDIAETLERRGWRGHFFVTTDRIGEPGFLDGGQIRELAARGHEVGSHSATHPAYMARLPESAIRREWTASRSRLAEVLGSPPRTAAVPGGSLSRAVIEEAAGAGYGLLMTSEPSMRTSAHGDMEVLGRYTIWSNTAPSTAAAYARGAWPARARLWIEWQAKGLAKSASPRVYDALRRVRAGGA